MVAEVFVLHRDQYSLVLVFSCFSNRYDCVNCFVVERILAYRCKSRGSVQLQS